MRNRLGDERPIPALPSTSVRPSRDRPSAPAEVYGSPQAPERRSAGPTEPPFLETSTRSVPCPDVVLTATYRNEPFAVAVPVPSWVTNVGPSAAAARAPTTALSTAAPSKSTSLRKASSFRCHRSYAVRPARSPAGQDPLQTPSTLPHPH